MPLSTPAQSLIKRMELAALLEIAPTKIVNICQTLIKEGQAFIDKTANFCIDGMPIQDALDIYDAGQQVQKLIHDLTEIQKKYQQLEQKPEGWASMFRPSSPESVAERPSPTNT